MLNVHADILRVTKHFAAKYEVAWESILAIGIVESGLNPFAIGDEGHSYGIMQLNDQGAGAGLQTSDMLWFPYNIEHGCWYYAACVDATPTREDAFSAYNQGVEGWRRNGKGANPAYWQACVLNHDRIVSEGVSDMVPAPYYSWS